EEIMFKMNQDILDTVKKIGQMGIKIALDDFGCEYSTLKLLRKIPINYLKLDKSNIKSVGSDYKDEKLLTELIALGNKLQLDIIAEGVEKEEQLIFLKNNGCSNIQGYMISKPKSPDQIEQMIYNYNLVGEKNATSSEYYCS
ncbi:MAG: EAL domain-containing protein, partial [Clostridia bacterium]|nr:EAL domain-containing protein [Clostridia bacterium]